MKRAGKLLLIILSPYIIIVLGLYLAQQRLIFLPGKLPSDYSYAFQRPFEELFITTEDGAVLNALHFKADKTKGLVVYYHGNAGDLSGWGRVADDFPDHDVLMLDYRTYGKSTGEISEAALYADADLFYEEAKKRFPERNIMVYGRSLGATFAAYAAARHTPARLVLETPFYNLTDVVKSQYWFLPVDLLLRFKFPTSEFIGDVECPVTVIHGTEDNVVSYKSGQRLFEAIQSEKELVTIQEGGHNNLNEFEEYHQAIKRVF
ncbi:MAG: alpha/beta fold hydrolase [Bacteroidota bacterium]